MYISSQALLQNKLQNIKNYYKINYQIIERAWNYPMSSVGFHPQHYESIFVWTLNGTWNARNLKVKWDL